NRPVNNSEFINRPIANRPQVTNLPYMPLRSARQWQTTRPASTSCMRQTYQDDASEPGVQSREDAASAQTLCVVRKPRRIHPCTTDRATRATAWSRRGLDTAFP